MAVLCPAKILLGIVNAGKILGAITALLQNPRLLYDGIRLVQVNVILAYWKFLFMPMRSEKLRDVAENQDQWVEDIIDRKRTLSDFDDVLKIGEDVFNSIPWVMDMKVELTYMDATVIKYLLLPAYIVMFLYKSYTKTAVALHFANAFVRIHFRGLDYSEDPDMLYFYIGFNHPQWMDLYNHWDSVWALDSLALVLYTIPHQTRRKWYVSARRIFLMKILRHQQSFLDSCAHGHVEALKNILVQHQDWININARMDKSGDTGLHLASAKGHLSIVQFLLEKNVIVHIENSEGCTPLALAARRGHKSIMKALLKARNLRLREEQVERVLKEVFSGDAFDFEGAKLILNEYKRREGKELDANFTSHVNKCIELTQQLGVKGAKRQIGPHRKEIQKWLESKHSMRKSRGNLRQSRTREELIKDLQEHSECGICYEEYLGGEIWACANDHWLCRTCVASMTRARSSIDFCCPTCRSDFAYNPPTRCHTSEKVLADVSALCQILELSQGRQHS